MALRNDELKIHDRFTLAELRTYVRNDRGSMSGSPHDARVMALALSNQMRQYAFMPEFITKQDDYWTVEWFRKLLLKSRGLETETFNFYLQSAQEYRKEEDRKNRLVGLKSYNANE